ncbi:NAD(P)/FAD-dependent oxidoreductase [Lusitaniella coriacea LEGE 07157]|uniref:NAD(P)/FAD-dependent oxidoreductase n=1 Tax=Lusitaniella coriacea LEGE 07157 TaxID=945747 RepID=A0A8J7AMV1_9CYAN|nr:NAD(P)/FAD-dependent oxidoreductase [Lusitaniella coriacea]MBE9114753.1 NAD(P)/FAD-dependent oxidoreductase [Lusitaniella coriacea LEGE 07157]
MSVEYDLVVIGGSVEGIYAAIAATYLNARVALVEQGVSPYADVLYRRAIARIGDGLHQCDNIFPFATQAEFSRLDLAQAISWAKEICATFSAAESRIRLATLGVDAIAGKGEFIRLPHLAFQVQQRQLRSRAYLLAMGSSPVAPSIQGLTPPDYLTPNDLWQQEKLKTLPQNLLIVGGSPLALELSQSLNRLGKSVTLIVEDERLLSAEDPQAIRWIQATLEAEGICLFTQSPIAQVQKIDGKTWVQAGDRAIETDCIICAQGQQPDLEGLNLEGVGIRVEGKRLHLNEKLQTTNPRIYGCGSIAGGYSSPQIARYEAQIALHNALFSPWVKKCDYRHIPWTLLTEPNFARVGMTERQAQQRYGKDIFVAQHYFKEIPQAWILGQTTGFCKFVFRNNGEMLGAHIVGTQAAELIGTVTLAMKHRLKANALAELFFPSPSISEILQQTAQEWQLYALKRNKIRRHLRTQWLRWRRN